MAFPSFDNAIVLSEGANIVRNNGTSKDPPPSPPKCESKVYHEVIFIKLELDISDIELVEAEFDNLCGQFCQGFLLGYFVG